MGTPSPRLDVLFLTHNYPRHDGDFAGRFLERLACLLTERGARVGILAPHHPGASEQEEMHGVMVRRFRYGSDAQEVLAYRGDWGGATLTGPHGLWAHYRFFRSFAHAARRFVQEAQPRVIHAHWWIPAGWVARRLVGESRLVVTLHGTDLRLLQRKVWMRPLAARVFARAHIITTVSTWLGEDLARRFRGIHDKLGVAPMPPEDSLFTGAPRAATSNPPIVLSVTRFTKQKRNDVLLQALALLRNRGVEFRARLVGEGGAFRDETEAQIQQLGLAPFALLAGSKPQSELVDEYRSADVTVLSAIDEGLGLALVEAQLCGCAVVGARSGGITDIIADGQSGLLVPPGDPVALADALQLVLTDSRLRVRLATDGQKSALTRFSAQTIVDRFWGWYRFT
jgi:glycosyltransferase involved in cell wall biosynthesis